VRLNRILLEQTSNESRIKVGSDFHDPAVSESAKPAIPVVKPEPVLGGSFGVQFHHGPVIAYQKMFYVELGALWQNFRQLVEGMCDKISLRVIVPRKRVCPLDNPVDIVGDVLEEPFAITRFEISKDLVNIGGGQLLRIRNRGHVRNYLAMDDFTPPGKDLIPDRP
jgi:hypothetical protein